MGESFVEEMGRLVKFCFRRGHLVVPQGGSSLGLETKGGIYGNSQNQWKRILL